MPVAVTPADIAGAPNASALAVPVGAIVVAAIAGDPIASALAIPVADIAALILADPNASADGIPIATMPPDDGSSRVKLMALFAGAVYALSAKFTALLAGGVYAMLWLHDVGFPV